MYKNKLLKIKIVLLTLIILFLTNFISCGSLTQLSNNPTNTPVQGKYDIPAPTTINSDISTVNSQISNSNKNYNIIEKEDQDLLKADFIDDNKNFNEYLNYIKNFKYNTSVIPVDITERYIITVYDYSQRTIPETNITIYDNNKNEIFTGKTYSNGQILFFPKTIRGLEQITEFEVKAEKGDHENSKIFKRNSYDHIDITFAEKIEKPEKVNLDILFLIDSTGSMRDEINKIKNKIKDISYRIKSFLNKSTINWGLVSYKDKGDDYVVKKFDFTKDIEIFQQNLNDIKAEGGGDESESLNEALYNSIENSSWTFDESIRLIFLIADAPPHLDYDESYVYTDGMIDAVKKGIKIYPIAASGLNPMGEYIFRQMAQFTFSKFIFITYDKTSTFYNTYIGEFKENNLDDLIVNVVKEELYNYLE